MTDRIAALSELVAAEEARWRRLEWLRAAGFALSVALGVFLVAVAVDHVIRLPMAGRGLAALLVGAAFVAAGRIVWTAWRRERVSDDAIALAIERRTPGGVENRLINALQIGRASRGPLREALVQENCRRLSERPLAGSAAALPALVAGLVAGGLIVAAVAGWAWRPNHFRTAASRILLPFAAIDPVYRTILVVEPGDVEAAGDVEVRVRIRGERPGELAVILDSAERRSTQIVPVPPGRDAISYTIPNVVRSMTYAVRGGDFTSPRYRIDVPSAPRIARVRAEHRYPRYTRLAPRVVESTGDLEAIEGTRTTLHFTLDLPVDGAVLVTRSDSTGRNAPAERGQGLTKLSATEFRGELVFDGLAEYRLELAEGSRPPRFTPWQRARVVPDEPPKAELAGVPSTGEIPIDAPVSLRVSAQDDIGLSRWGVFARRSAVGMRGAAADEWKPVAQWGAAGKTQAIESVELLAASLGIVEGDRLELAARAADFHPGRAGEWTTGPVVAVVAIGDGVQLQLVYEQILRSEAELAALIETGDDLHRHSDVLVRKLDAGALVDDGSPPRVKELVDWAAGRSGEQGTLREAAARVAREMVAEAGSLRLSLGMLADTEMIRTLRVLDSVATRDDAAGRRMSLAEARATQHRTLASLRQIHEQFVRFRHEWELAHMVPFVRMLADRQGALRDQSRQRADANEPVPRPLCEAALRRQKKLLELCGLAATAFTGLAERTQELEEELSAAFGQSAESLESDELTRSMAAAATALTASQWSDAAKEQEVATDLLVQIVAALQDAQSAAAKRALAALEDRPETDLAAQAALEKLKAGSGEDLLDEPEGLKLSNVIHALEVAQDRNAPKKDEPKPNEYLFPDSARGILQQPDTGKRQEFDILKLATSPGTTPSFPKQSDREGNRVKPHIQEEFEDLVGDLLEEEDEMKANYETYNLNAAFNINEPGEIGKQAGDLNSTAAAAATGNMKPPTTNVGGASRVGRQGARAFGAAMGNESINRRGRDKVQEGQERSPDQAGSVKETKSDDPQKDTSTGVGGRRVESDDAKFSLNDAGEWSDDMAGRMEKPKETHSIVERQGKGLDAQVAEAMRDMQSKQEQTLERLKSIRKELRNLYLPTEHLDELIAKMQANLHSLNERPSADVYRLQQQTLDELRGALQVFHQAHAGFQASLPRDQRVKGRVLDDPARAAPPGYEDAVRSYYRRLSAP